MGRGVTSRPNQENKKLEYILCGWDGVIRTHDLRMANATRYRTALHPDTKTERLADGIHTRTCFPTGTQIVIIQLQPNNQVFLVPIPLPIQSGRILSCQEIKRCHSSDDFYTGCRVLNLGLISVLLHSLPAHARILYTHERKNIHVV